MGMNAACVVLCFISFAPRSLFRLVFFFLFVPKQRSVRSQCVLSVVYCRNKRMGEQTSIANSICANVLVSMISPAIMAFFLYSRSFFSVHSFLFAGFWLVAVVIVVTVVFLSFLWLCDCSVDVPFNTLSARVSFGMQSMFNLLCGTLFSHSAPTLFHFNYSRSRSFFFHPHWNQSLYIHTHIHYMRSKGEHVMFIVYVVWIYTISVENIYHLTQNRYCDKKKKKNQNREKKNQIFV